LLLNIELFLRYCLLGSNYIGGHEFDLSGSRDIIDHVSVWFPIGHFLLVVLWNPLEPSL